MSKPLAVGLFFFSFSSFILFGCGSDTETNPVFSHAADASPNGDASDSARDATDNDCTSRGALYECHPNPTCNPEYMPLSNISCGAKGGYCCMKGALPPGDASTDG